MMSDLFSANSNARVPIFFAREISVSHFSYDRLWMSKSVILQRATPTSGFTAINAELSKDFKRKMHVLCPLAGL